MRAATSRNRGDDQFELHLESKVRERSAAVRLACRTAAAAAIIALVGQAIWSPATYVACVLLGWSIKAYADARNIETRFSGFVSHRS